MGPPIAGPEDYLVGSLDAISPFIPVAGAVRGVKRIGKTLHGLASAESGGDEVSSIKSVVDQGFTLGNNIEINRRGASTSGDPHMVLERYTEGLRPSQMVVVDSTADPNKVWNIPPDFARAGIPLGVQDDVLSMPNQPLTENELFYGKPLVRPEDLQDYLDFEKRAKELRASRNEAFDGPGYHDPEQRAIREAEYDILEKMQAMEDMSPVQLGKPRRVREAERGNIEGAKQRLQNWNANLKAAFHGTGRPDRTVRNLVTSLDALRTAGPGGQPSRGAYNSNLYSVAAGLSNDSSLDLKLQNTFQKAAADPDSYSALSLAADRYHQAVRNINMINPKDAFAGKSREEIAAQVEEAGGDISNIGDPGYREAYRDLIEARDRFAEALHGFAFKVVPGG